MALTRCEPSHAAGVSGNLRYRRHLSAAGCAWTTGSRPLRRVGGAPPRRGNNSNNSGTVSKECEHRAQCRCASARCATVGRASTCEPEAQRQKRPLHCRP
uniref:Uncharacterized protein n=1 Tax=Alexandrium monilatum TaxID=311494 RepID=A0A7S4URZ5_9DINO